MTEKEYIERKALIETLNKNNIPYNADVNYFIMHAPTADVVEIIYCKDCKHRDPEDKKCDIFQGLCRGILSVKDNDFCSYGERKG